MQRTRTSLILGILLLGVGLAQACNPVVETAVPQATATRRNLLPATWTAAPPAARSPTTSPTVRPTATRTPVPTRTPPVALTLEAAQTLTAAAPTPTAYLFGLPASWVPYESPNLAISFAYPDLLVPIEGQAIVLASTVENFSAGGFLLPLTGVLTVTNKSAPNFPPAVDRNKPADVVNAMVAALAVRVASLEVVEPAFQVLAPGSRAEAAVVRVVPGVPEVATAQPTGEPVGEATEEPVDEEQVLLYYLAAVIQGERVVLVSLSTPAETGGRYFQVARSLIRTLEFR